MRHHVLPLRWPVRRVVVSGASMRPTLEPGDRLVLIRARHVRAGDLVGLADPRRPGRLLVKRLRAVARDGYVVTGDNAAASTDSRQFGPVTGALLRGRAVYRYAPAHRRGRLQRTQRRHSDLRGWRPWPSSTPPGSSPT